MLSKQSHIPIFKSTAKSNINIEKVSFNNNIVYIQ
jgi:hypothetical protein